MRQARVACSAGALSVARNRSSSGALKPPAPSFLAWPFLEPDNADMATGTHGTLEHLRTDRFQLVVSRVDDRLDGQVGKANVHLLRLLRRLGQALEISLTDRSADVVHRGA
jgi:hypothetical protein